MALRDGTGLRRREVTATSRRSSGQWSGGNTPAAASARASRMLNPPHSARAADAEPTRARADRRERALPRLCTPANWPHPTARAANSDAELARPAPPGKLLRASAR